MYFYFKKKMTLKKLFILIIIITFFGCDRKHYHCYCSFSGSNPEKFESDYGTRYTYKEKELRNACIANEQKRDIDKCSLQ